MAKQGPGYDAHFKFLKRVIAMPVRTPYTPGAQFPPKPSPPKGPQQK